MTNAAAEIFDPQLLAVLRAAPWRTVERRFLLILLASICLHLAFATYLTAQPMPATEAQSDEPLDRFPARVTLPPLLPIPKAKVAPAAGPTRRVAPAPDAAPTTAADRTRVARAAVLRVVGAPGPGGTFAGLLDAPVDELAQALDGAKGFHLASAGLAAPRGPAAGEAATIAPLGTDGVRSVALGTRVDKAPTTAVAGAIVIDDADEVDPRVLQQFVSARRAAVQSCYERALLHNPAMRGGKVVLRMAIGPRGRVSSLRVEEDTLGSDAVTACMSTLMGRWVFPVTPKDEFPLSVPFVFARAN